VSKNILVISVELRETRVALIENGIIAELHIERSGNKQSTVGNVYLGKVTRVLPGLQAAFIDIGQERAAFLHVEDLIRPNDFEAYLAGGRKGEISEGAATAGEDEEGDDAEVLVEPGSPPAAASSTALIEPANSGQLPALLDHADDPRDESSVLLSQTDASSVSLGAEEDGDHDGDDVDVDVDVDETTEGEHGATDVHAAMHDHDGVEASSEPSKDGDDDDGDDVVGDDVVAKTEDDLFDMPGFTISEPGEPVPRAASPREGRGGAGGDAGRRGRGRRGRKGTEREPRRDKRPPRPNPMMQNRLAKTTPIREVVQEGQEVIVQVTKDPISTKGARCSSHVSFPGRYVVYVPTVDHIGISKRIGSDRERGRLREAIEAIKPATGGLIVRTVAEGLTKKQLKQDVGYLVKLWGEIAKRKEEAKAPSMLFSELDLVLKVARDLFTDEVGQIVVDDKQQYERLIRFIEMFAPDRVKDIVLYSAAEPLFDAYGITDEIQRALSRKVPLPSGGYLIIDQAEALTAIDVNTGRYVGKGAKDMEDAILKTNLEAVNEIAYQLRFRNLGGLIILDLIDMEKSSNREKVRRTLEGLLVNDKAKTTLNRISDLGLIEMTRKRTRESLGRLLHEPCFYCDGTGQLQSKETIAYEILREVKRKRADLPGYTIQISAHPAVVDLLTGPEKAAVAECENKFMRKISVVPRKDYHLEQFDIAGK
jgi:ribonuclease G